MPSIITKDTLFVFFHGAVQIISVINTHFIQKTIIAEFSNHKQFKMKIYRRNAFCNPFNYMKHKVKWCSVHPYVVRKIGLTLKCLYVLQKKVHVKMFGPTSIETC